MRSKRLRNEIGTLARVGWLSWLRTSYSVLQTCHVVARNPVGKGNKRKDKRRGLGERPKVSGPGGIPFPSLYLLYDHRIDSKAS